MTIQEHAVRPGEALSRLPTESPLALLTETDLDQAVANLQRRYPDLCFWWGEYTGSLWALLPDQLVEAKTALQLAQRIDAIRERSALPKITARPAQREAPPSRAADGTWNVRQGHTPSPSSRSRHIDVTRIRRHGDLLNRFAAGCRRILLGGARALAHAR